MCGWAHGCHTADVDALLFGAVTVYRTLALHTAAPRNTQMARVRRAAVQRVLQLMQGGAQVGAGAGAGAERWLADWLAAKQERRRYPPPACLPALTLLARLRAAAVGIQGLHPSLFSDSSSPCTRDPTPPTPPTPPHPTPPHPTPPHPIPPRKPQALIAVAQLAGGDYDIAGAERVGDVLALGAVRCLLKGKQVRCRGAGMRQGKMRQGKVGWGGMGWGAGLLRACDAALGCPAAAGRLGAQTPVAVSALVRSATTGLPVLFCQLQSTSRRPPPRLPPPKSDEGVLEALQRALAAGPDPELDALTKCTGAAGRHARSLPTTSRQPLGPPGWLVPVKEGLRLRPPCNAPSPLFAPAAAAAALLLTPDPSSRIRPPTQAASAAAMRAGARAWSSLTARPAARSAAPTPRAPAAAASRRAGRASASSMRAPTSGC
jgi:hypothetical protein